MSALVLKLTYPPETSTIAIPPFQSQLTPSARRVLLEQIVNNMRELMTPTLQTLRHKLDQLSRSQGGIQEGIQGGAQRGAQGSVQANGYADGKARRTPVAFGISDIDTALGGGLTPGALHDFYTHQTADSGSLSGFLACMAQSLNRSSKPVVWVRQTAADFEAGQLYPHGLKGLGLEPNCLILVRARKAIHMLSAALEAVRCASLGCVIVEAWGAPRELDLTATRRLALAAEQSGVTPLFLRAASDVQPSAAVTRWQVRSAPSRIPLHRTPSQKPSKTTSKTPSNALGHPTFDLTLTRNKAGTYGQSWRVEWHHDLGQFQPITKHTEHQHSQHRKSASDQPLSGGVVSLPTRRQGGQAEFAKRGHADPNFGQTG